MFWFDVLFKSEQSGECITLWYHAQSGLLPKCFVINGRESCDYWPSLSLSTIKLVSNHAITLSTSLGGKLINYRLSKLGLNNVISNSMGFET